MRRGLARGGGVEDYDARAQTRVGVEVLRSVVRDAGDPVVLGGAQRGGHGEDRQWLADERFRGQRARVVEDDPVLAQRVYPSASADARAFAASVIEPPPTVTMASGRMSPTSAMSRSSVSSGTCWARSRETSCSDARGRLGRYARRPSPRAKACSGAGPASASGGRTHRRGRRARRPRKGPAQCSDRRRSACVCPLPLADQLLCAGLDRSVGTS